MQVRADWSVDALVTPADHDWIPSPQPGVKRVLLDRIGDEVAIATSLLRYAAGSDFPLHEHGRGEEFLVLDGVFMDEHRAYPAGTYVRNPPGTAHAPSSPDGCLIFVKLRQFLEGDLEPRVIDLTPFENNQPGPNVSQWHMLHEFGAETVSLLRLGEGAVVDIEAGEVPRELLVLSGELDLDGQNLAPWSWLRVAPGRRRALTARGVATCFVKDRPLPG
jgi:quercetin dioxygenase-like cupin family protein